MRKAVDIVEDGEGREDGGRVAEDVEIGDGERVEDVDLILEKYKHLNESNDCELVLLKEHKEDKNEDWMDDNDFELDEKEAEELEENNEEVYSKKREVGEDLINIDNVEGDNDCIEDTSDYLTEPEDNAEEEKSDTNDTNKEDEDTVSENPETQKVVLLKNHDGLDLENPLKKRKVQCNQCDWTGVQTGLNYHKKSKHLGIRFKCPHCDFSSPRTEYLSSHIVSKHRKVVEKKIRDSATLPIEDEEIFEKLVAAEVELEVKKAKDKLEKEEIAQEYYPSNGEKLDKQETEKKEAAKEKLEKDVSVKENGFKCSQCDWVVGTGNGLRYHQRRVHEGLKNGKYKCNYCNFKSTSKSYMTNHMMNEHKGQKDDEIDLPLQDPESFRSKIKIEQDSSGGFDKDSNINFEDFEKILPPFWQPADPCGLVFTPPTLLGGKARRFESYQLAVKWLIETGFCKKMLKKQKIWF